MGFDRESKVACQAPMKIALWGMGNMYRDHINLLLALQSLGKVELVGVVDSREINLTTLDGMPAGLPKMLGDLEFNYLVVLSKNYPDEIISEAVEQLGIPRNKVLTYGILHVPYFDFEKYRRLQESRLSIISDSCWGGMACNLLQIECLSPFKNATFSNSNFLKAIGDLEALVKYETPRFIGKRETSSGLPCNVFEWGDVVFGMAHEEDEGRCLEDWLRRRDKVNWDNLFVEMNTVDRDYEKTFNGMSQYDAKVCFVPYKTEEPCSIQMPMSEKHGHFYDAVNEAVSAKSPNLPFSVLDLFLGEGDPRRYKIKE